MKSFFTFVEWWAVFAKWPDDKALAWNHVSLTQFSVARHYGGMSVNGKQYTYCHETDELIRDDVLKFVAKMRKAKKAVPTATQQELLP
jgi:hypothetical protein